MRNRYTQNDEIIVDDEQIIVKGNKVDGMVMHASEKTLMIKLAELATRNGGDILELGFGMHLSADGVQSNPNVTSHTIIEIHPDVYKLALNWASSKPNTEILLGDWIDVLPTITKKFDGILHDTYMDPNIDKFLDYVKPNCKKGTIVAFFEYVGNHNCMSALRFSLTDEEFNSLPYKDYTYWKLNSIELKYTIFDGEKFCKDTNIKQLL
jgi:hypothetical protein